MTIHIRKCPGCKQERPATESLCSNCSWDLTQERLSLPGQIDQLQEPVTQTSNLRHCMNGHTLDAWDEICLVPNCGAEEKGDSVTAELSQSSQTVIDGWSVVDRKECDSDVYESFVVERHGHRALLTYYFPGCHPDLSLYEILKRLPKENIPDILAYGEWECRRYDVADISSTQSLQTGMSDLSSSMNIQDFVKSIGRILGILGENGLRHGNIKPENILINRQDPLELQLTGFQYCHLSNFDLDAVIQPPSAYYTAPEVIAGGISAASDWWSLGVVILQLLKKGQFFDGIHEKAFRIHVVTRGISIPKAIDPSVSLLLRGLLAQDPNQRWRWMEVQKWLNGEDVETPSALEADEERIGPAFDLMGHSYVCPKRYALAAAEASNWEQAKEFFKRGNIATWLEECKIDAKVISGVRGVASIDSIPEDFRLALALMWMNPSLPLIYKGEIVTSAWLLKHPSEGYDLITGSITNYLQQMKRELYLCELRDRAEKAREKAKILEIQLDEESFRLLVLTSSRTNIERQWAIRRRLFPGSEHRGLNSLIDRQKATDDEMIILLAATVEQHLSAEQILSNAKTIATQAGVESYAESTAIQWFDVSRRDIYHEIEDRTANYSKCGVSRVDEWASEFRLQKRISLPRALVLLSLPKEAWKEPDRLQYVSRILEFFEKRTVNLAQRGPLVRMVISKASPKVDLAEIPGKKPPASSILEHLISRSDIPVNIDGIAFDENIDLEKKFRRLVGGATTYKRDTGIDSLYLGFPFLISRDFPSEDEERKPKISPILLWPIKIEIEARDKVSIAFDSDREEVRLNPTLARVLGVEEVKIWEEAVKELLGRSSIRASDVIDALGALAKPRERTLSTLPAKDHIIKPGEKQLVCSAVLFHAQFMGQALVEDLRQMQKETPTGSALETVLRVSRDQAVRLSIPLVPERDRYFTMESDPSQEKAVFSARQHPGLLIEGPPGTGKSQTIVNIIADCIGRDQAVLVVCQKPAALEVLAKRLDAEGLRDRFFYITHVNKDRTPVLQNIRTQIESIYQSRGKYKSKRLEQERDELAEKIQNLEKDIDGHHSAIHEIDTVTGLSYRELLGELIDIEDQEIGLIDVPTLRNKLGAFDQKQLNVLEEVCPPIAGLWLQSSYEKSPLARLKQFSSDATVVEDFSSGFQELVAKEKARNEIGRVKGSFDVSDPLPHQEWIRSYDTLFKGLDWEKLASWFDLFNSGGALNGQEIIRTLEGVKKELASLDANKQEQSISSKLIDIPTATINKWLSIAEPVTALKAASFDILNDLKCQLGEIKIQLDLIDLSKFDQVISSKLTDSDIVEIDDWLSLFERARIINSKCYSQLELLQNKIEDQKNLLNAIPHGIFNQDLALKLVDIKTSRLNRWLALTKKVLAKKSILGFLNPFNYTRLYFIKRALKNLNEELSMGAINQLQSSIKLEIYLRPIRKIVGQLEKTIYTENKNSKPLFTKELFDSIGSMMPHLSNVAKIRQTLTSYVDNFNFKNVNRFHKACELEKQVRPIRESCLKIQGQIYHNNQQSNHQLPEDLQLLIKTMIADLRRASDFKEILCDLNEVDSFVKAKQLKDAASLERELRPLRIAVEKYLSILYPRDEILKSKFLKDLILIVDALISDLTLTQKGVAALLACPRVGEIQSILEGGFSVYLDLVARYEEAFTRHHARVDSLVALEKLFPYFSDEFYKICKSNIENNVSCLADLHPLLDALPTLSFYQEYRLYVPSLSEDVLSVFSCLRKKDKQLRNYPIEQLDGVIRRIIAREARLAWKDRMEQNLPKLRSTHKELTRKIGRLKEADFMMRGLNKKFLASNIDTMKIASADEWENITRLRGPRARRLREIVELGSEMGLMQLRPIWLMNPDTASQLFSLRVGIFDVIVFDEASQIPIENSLPSLYRAKRVVISGDEKQMPPTSVFVKRFEDDEDDDCDDEYDELRSEAEIDALEDMRNRQDIKDCSDLLALGKIVLPKTMLQIHYRSKYRELIAFSNAAFYENNLSIPVRHPVSVIQNARPIEIRRVDGVYANQTNKKEAQAVVEILAEKWASADRPSIGVVTFNAKQAELIGDALAERAEIDDNFRQALSKERERQQEGEDMRLFVKNVESVQGDERDMIIFSSTFGRDEKGKFRRQFGLLSQVGGERRLNVAVTRAREKVIIVTSLPINEISDALSKGREPKNSRDYLQAYFDYASSISDGALEAANSSLNRLISGSPSSQESLGGSKDGFLKSVANFIKSLGLNPLAIKENDAFGLDFVIEDPKNKRFGIGIECDAHCHEILKAARAREVWRPKVLNMGIPYVHRVPSYAWYHSRNEELVRLKEALEIALDISFDGVSIT